MSSSDFFHISQKIIQGHDQSIKRFGSKLDAKVIIRRQKPPQARMENPNNDKLWIFHANRTKGEVGTVKQLLLPFADRSKAVLLL